MEKSIISSALTATALNVEILSGKERPEYAAWHVSQHVNRGMRLLLRLHGSSEVQLLHAHVPAAMKLQ